MRIIILCISMILSFIKLHAQGPATSKMFDFAISERAEGIQISADKIGIYINIFDRGTVQPVLFEIKRDPFDLVSYTSMEKTKLGENSSVPVSIDKVAQGQNGDIFYTISKVAPSGNTFQYSYFLMKTTASNSNFKKIAEIGAKEKSKKYFQNVELLPNNNGGVYWIGTTRLKPNSASETNNDILIISFDKGGRVLWKQKYHGGRNDLATSAIITQDGGIIIGGKLNNKRGLVKYGSNGTKLWTYQPQNYGSLTKIMEADDSSIVLCGEGGPSSSRKNGNVHLEKISKDGKPIWATEYDNSGQTSDDVIDLLVSETTSIQLLVYSKLKKGHALNLIKVDTEGNIVAEKRMMDLQKIPKTYAGVKNLSFLRQMGDYTGVFSESNSKDNTGLFIGIVDKNLSLIYEHVLPRNGSASLHPLEAFYYEDGTFHVIAKDGSRFRGKNKLHGHYFKLK